MARKEQLRTLRKGTVINATSKFQDKILGQVVLRTMHKLYEEFPGIRLQLDTTWKLTDIVKRLQSHFPDVDFKCYSNRSFMKPDGGILKLIDTNGELYPILIGEMKNQGTNDRRAQEGLPQQSKGNAIERLGKNVIGFRTAMLMESIFPFVCFGNGCDFESNSTIPDRVVTIAMFGSLNKTYLHVQGERFNRGSFYFKVEPWQEDEMFEIASEIAEASVYYYFSKYGKPAFIHS